MELQRLTWQSEVILVVQCATFKLLSAETNIFRWCNVCWPRQFFDHENRPYSLNVSLAIIITREKLKPPACVFYEVLAVELGKAICTRCRFRSVLICFLIPWGQRTIENPKENDTCAHSLKLIENKYLINRDWWHVLINKTVKLSSVNMCICTFAYYELTTTEKTVIFIFPPFNRLTVVTV